MPDNLVIPSLEIRNFRGLRNLTISRLGRANLFTGKNNVGKTSVLEALRLYARPGSPELLLEVFEAREEIRISRSLGFGTKSPKSVPVDRLFTGRLAIPGQSDPIQIGPVGAKDKTLSISLEWGRAMVSRVTTESEDDDEELSVEKRLGLVFRLGGKRRFLALTNTASLARRSSFPTNTNTGVEIYTLPYYYVGSNGLNSRSIAELWDAVSLTEAESDVTLALRLVAPEVERVNLVSDAADRRERVSVARISQFQDPVPLRSLGDGVNRMFGIILSMINARNGLLLVDEFENGLHYSVQTDIWRLIFQVASKLNVQVFATTHSSDCVTAFQAAASESDEEGRLIYLGRRGDSIVADEFDEDALETATEAGMELRG